MADEGITRLKNLLVREARLASEVVDYIMGPLKLECTADLAGFFSESDYSQGVVAEILDHTPMKGDRLQRSRLRTAWELCRADLKLALQTKATGEVEVDWDRPLDPDLQKTQEKTFFGIYNLKFEPASYPSDALFGRVYREFRRKCPSVMELSKVRSAAQSSTVMGARTVKRIADGVAITVDGPAEEHDTPFTSVMSVLWALRILCHAWAMTGTTQRDSLMRAGTKVRDADMSECFAYYDFVYETALRHPGTQQQAQAWIIERDRQTRAKARSLYLEDWPWGEALRESRERHLAVLWTCGSAGMRAEQIPVAAGPRMAADPITPVRQPRAQALAASPPQSPTAAQCCRAFNSAAGCARRQRECPEGKLHRCSTAVGNGICGAWQHGRTACPRGGNRPATPTAETGAPGGQKRRR